MFRHQACDEEVWREIELFKSALRKMSAGDGSTESAAGNDGGRKKHKKNSKKKSKKRSKDNGDDSDSDDDGGGGGGGGKFPPSVFRMELCVFSLVVDGVGRSIRGVQQKRLGVTVATI